MKRILFILFLIFMGLDAHAQSYPPPIMAPLSVPCNTSSTKSQYVTGTNGCTLGSGLSFSGQTIVSSGGSTTINLGASTSSTNPRINGDATTGFWSSGAGHVDLAISGVNELDWNASNTTSLLSVPFSTTGVYVNNDLIDVAVSGSNSGGYVVGRYVGTVLSGTGSTTTGGHGVGIKSEVEFTGSGNIDSSYGVEGSIWYKSGTTGTIGTASPVLSYGYFDNNASLVMTNYRAFDAESGGNLAGTITNYIDYYSPNIGSNGGGTMTHEYGYRNDDSNKILLTLGRVMIGSTSNPSNAMDVSGGQVIGSGYAGSVTAQTNGLSVQGEVTIGTSSPQTGYALTTTSASIINGGYLVFPGSSSQIAMGTTVPISGASLTTNGAIALPYTSAMIIGASGNTTNNIAMGMGYLGGQDTLELGPIGNQSGDALILYLAGSGTGKVGIGSSIPAQALDVKGTIKQTTEISCATGLTTDSTGAINGCVASDIDQKENIQPLTISPDIFDKLKPVTYTWADKQKYDNSVHAGFIAQDVQKIFPEAIKQAGNGVLGIDPNSMLALYSIKIRSIANQVSVTNGAFPWHKCFFNLLVCPN